ncbi:hypothetical protein [Pantanalinema sp. GBBB05]|uniref:hypothetical protein n=1 Tax=Pantanalinema sp. GBBB05 TaxID=2604139 RepID=UPI001DA253E6|nr:hypothetical protein [Pantanalinema sp. GBBB05]
MDPGREMWLEVALYVAKTEEIQKRAAAIDQRLKAVIANSESIADLHQPQGSSLESQKALIDDTERSETEPLTTDGTPIEPQYEQVLILIWQ